MSLLELYCAVDDFCQAMEKERVGRLIRMAANADSEPES